MCKRLIPSGFLTKAGLDVRAGVTLGLLAFLALFAAIGRAQPAGELKRYEPIIVWKVSIVDEDWIDALVKDQMLLFEEPVAAIDIYDLEGNGFGINDVAVFKPQQKHVLLTDLGEDIKNSMAEWAIVENLHYSTGVDASDPDSIESKPLPVLGIAASALRGINRNYHDVPIQLYFRRDSSIVEMRVWGFNADSMRYAPSEAWGRGTGGFDIYHVMRADTTVVADTTMYDVIYVYRTYGDTVYLPGSSRASRSGDGER